jgi:DNA-binding NtrC family response regulator
MTTPDFSPAGQSAGAFLPDPTNSNQRILVVEAADDIRQLNAEVLVDAGFQVDAAEDGVAAWAALQLHRYDLLITDQFLPNVSGVELLKKLHAARMNLPVIMATGILPTWEFALHPCLQSVAMLRKPYTFDKLLSMVKHVLHPNAGARVASPQTSRAPNRRKQTLPVGLRA